SGRSRLVPGQFQASGRIGKFKKGKKTFLPGNFKVQLRDRDENDVILLSSSTRASSAYWDCLQLRVMQLGWRALGCSLL
ncbi:hypothetical protein E3U43_022022, partial [Larimichthys crocea]